VYKYQGVGGGNEDGARLSSQWCPVTGQKAMGTKWSTENYIEASFDF